MNGAEPFMPLTMAGTGHIDAWQTWALDQGFVPPPWYRPVVPQASSHNHICHVCDVRWHGPKHQPGACWFCGVEGLEAA